MNQLNSMGWVRLGLYLISGVVGLAAVAVNIVGMTELSALLGTIAGAGAAITGGTAAFNLPKATDQLGGLKVEQVVPKLMEAITAAQAYATTPTTDPTAAVATPAGSSAGLPSYTITSTGAQA